MFYFLRSFKFLITRINSYFLLFFEYTIYRSILKKDNSQIDNKLKNLFFGQIKDYENFLIIDSNINKYFHSFLKKERMERKYILFIKNKIYKYLRKNNNVITFSEEELLKELNKLDMKKIDVIVLNNILEKLHDEKVYFFLKFLIKKFNPEGKILINLDFSSKLYPKPFAQRYMPPRVWNNSMHKNFYYKNTLLLEDYLNIMEDIGFKHTIKNTVFLKNELTEVKKNINPIYFCYPDSELILSKCSIEGSLK